MVRDNMMKILVGVAVVAGLLTAYNAFFNSNDNADQTATGRLTSYLSLDRAQQESESADTNVVGTDNANNSSTEAEPGAPAAEPEQPAATPEPSAPAPAEQPAATPEPEQPAQNNQPAASAPQTPAGDKPETIYTVAEGDTYACIAEKYYGSYEHYVEVMNANPVNWEGFSEYELHVGAKIVLPAIAQAALKTPSSRCN